MICIMRTKTNPPMAREDNIHAMICIIMLKLLRTQSPRETPGRTVHTILLMKWVATPMMRTFSAAAPEKTIGS